METKHSERNFAESPENAAGKNQEETFDNPTIGNYSQCSNKTALHTSY